MGKLFSYDGLVYKFLSCIADLMFLNVLWLIGCLPIITIGCSTTAMNYCCLRLCRGDGSIWKDFWKSYRLNLKQMIPMWLIVLAAGAVLFLEVMLCSIYDFTGKRVVVALFIAGVVGFMGLLSFLFPLQAQFCNTIKKTFFNAIAFAITHWNVTLKMVILRLLPLIWFLLDPVTFERFLIVWPLIGMSIIEYFCAKLITPVFLPYLQEETQAEEIA